MAETHTGGCHCGLIRYEVDLDLHQQGTTRCNCTWCRKSGWWATQVAPGSFRVHAEVPLDDADGAVYCPSCHVLVYSRGDLPEFGGAFVNLNVRTLDSVELDGVPIVYLDGLHDTWDFLGSGHHVDPFSKRKSGGGAQSSGSHEEASA